MKVVAQARHHVSCLLASGPFSFNPLQLFVLIVQLTLTPAQQQLLLQQAQAQAQLLAAAVQQHSASQQHSAAGATISASAATPMTQIPLSQPIQIAQVSEEGTAAFPQQ